MARILLGFAIPLSPETKASDLSCARNLLEFLHDSYAADFSHGAGGVELFKTPRLPRYCTEAEEGFLLALDILISLFPGIISMAQDIPNRREISAPRGEHEISQMQN